MKGKWEENKGMKARITQLYLKSCAVTITEFEGSS